MLPALDLFSGIGGFSLAYQGVFNTVAYCEIDTDCRDVLKNAMHCGYIDSAPIYEDVKKLTPARLKVEGCPDIRVITAGFPCQDISSAAGGGNRVGVHGKRSSLFAQVVRLARDMPTVDLVVLENSPNIVNRGEQIVVSAFNDIGFDVYCSIYAATDCLALHIRRRWIAYAVRRGRLSDMLLGLPSRFQNVKDITHIRDAQKQLGAFRGRWEKQFPPYKRMISKQQCMETWGTVSRCFRTCGMFGNSVVPQMVRLTLVIMCYIWNNPQSIVINVDCAKTNKDNIVKYTTGNRSQKVYPKPYLVPRPPLMFPIFDGKGIRHSQYFYTPVRDYAHYKVVKSFGRRSRTLLGTQLYYMHDRPCIKNMDVPRYVNPDFVEFLMGFPKRYLASMRPPHGKIGA
jgi:site-specific DNA-cytosine methylase